MKKVLFVFALLWGTITCFASGLDEQEIQTEDKKCAIHYLTSKPKKLWSIDVNPSYCHEGLVHGFTSVVLKDSLGRTAKTLEGYFYKGYWLSDYIGETDTFYRISPDWKQQDFVFLLAFDDELKTTFYLAAHAEEKEGNYSSFEVCSQQPVLFALHQPVEDFKASLFQSKLLKKAQKLISTKCPSTQKFTLLGVEKMTFPVTWMFQAQVDLKNSEINLMYRPDKDLIPRPSELRREVGEKLLTVPAQKVPEKEILLNETISKEKQTKLNGVQSAVDLALLAQVFQREVEGQVVVYVENRNADYSFAVTRPYPLMLHSQEMLSPGWYLVNGVFHPDKGAVVLQVQNVKHCPKEWCLDD